MSRRASDIVYGRAVLPLGVRGLLSVEVGPPHPFTYGEDGAFYSVYFIVCLQPWVFGGNRTFGEFLLGISTLYWHLVFRFQSPFSINFGGICCYHIVWSHCSLDIFLVTR